MKYVLLFIVLISAEAYAPVHCDKYIDKGYEKVLEREFKAEQYEMFKEAVAHSESRGESQGMEPVWVHRKVPVRRRG